MEPGALLFVTLVGLSGLGLLWFRVIEPIVDSIRAARHNTDALPYVAAASLCQTDQTLDQTLDQTVEQPASQSLRQVPLDVLRSLRQHNYSREDARTLLRVLGFSLDNNVWAAAAESNTTAAVSTTTAAAPATQINVADARVADVPRTPIANRPYDPSRYELVRESD